MKQEEIRELIEMHLQSAADALQIYASSGEESVKYFGERSAKTSAALRFLMTAVNAEREACAEIADEYVQIWSRGGPRKQTAPSSIRSGAGREIATAIRSRGDSNLVQSDDVQDEAQSDHLM